MSERDESQHPDQVRKYALSCSGGKDSMLALDRMVRQGLEVRHLFNIYEGNTGRIRFHGIRRELIEAQARALGLALVQEATQPADYETALGRALDRLRQIGIDAVAFGNIHLEDIRGWYEERTTARGFRHVEPLWGEAPRVLLSEFLDRGYRALVAGVNLELGRAEWLGRELDRELVDELEALEGVDVAGERGEYHTFVFDGPLFRRPVPIRVGDAFEREGHRLQELHPQKSSRVPTNTARPRAG